MCFKFKCRACKLPRYDYCTEWIMTDHEWCNVASETPWGSLRKRCDTCHVILGVIKELQSLVFREPWLTTEGKAGAPQSAAWEIGEEHWDEEYDSEGEDADGFTKEERRKVRQEAEAAVMKRWGVLKAEQSDKKVAEKELVVTVSVLEQASDSE